MPSSLNRKKSCQIVRNSRDPWEGWNSWLQAKFVRQLPEPHNRTGLTGELYTPLHQDHISPAMKTCPTAETRTHTASATTFPRHTFQLSHSHF